MAHEAFKNEPETDFTLPENADAFRAALADVASKLGASYPMIIDGKQETGGDDFASINPADPQQVIGRFSTRGCRDRGFARSRRRTGPFQNGPGSRPKSVPSTCSGRPSKSASADTSSPPGWFTR